MQKKSKKLLLNEEKIGQQELILEKILETCPVGIALVENRVYKWVNQEMVRIFGYDSKEEFEEKSVRIIYSSLEEYEQVGEWLYRDLAIKGTLEYEITLCRKDQSLFPANVRINCADGDNPTGWNIVIYTDISQKKAAQKAAAEKERLQGVLEMAGAVCHEINQPLQAIIGFSDLLLLERDDEKIMDRGLNAIKSQAERLGRITQKLSNVTHYKTVEYPGNRTIVDIWGSGGGSHEVDPEEAPSSEN